jgi:hypothetical protein
MEADMAPLSADNGAKIPEFHMIFSSNPVCYPLANQEIA